MWKAPLYVLFFVATCIECNGRGPVRHRPKPMVNFEADKVTGRWYVQLRFITCQFVGARGFTDSTIDVSLVPKQYFHVIKTQRVGPICASVSDKRYFKPENRNCAVHLTKDTIGNLYSGERVITATDYTSFLVYWFCLKYSQEDPRMCEDPGMTIYTRTRAPSQQTMHVIYDILQSQFKLGPNDLDAVTHDNRE